jgi:aspartate carbamoyltransferase catalytic subunit
VLSGYSDLIVMRHEKMGSVAEFAAASRVPVINGGDGANEHPSQALLDLYTISRELTDQGKAIDGMRIALVGDLRFGRAVHSLCKLLGIYRNISFSLISPEALRLPSSYIESLRSAGHTVVESSDMASGLQQADIVYVTRTQEERFESADEAQRYKGLLRLNQAVYTQYCEPNTVIMHPLPRDTRAEANELDNDLNDNPNLAIFRQTDNGVLIRMALFALILNVADQIDATSRPVNWYTAKRF